jgi:DNA-binding CsgD family transcriptional regulator
MVLLRTGSVAEAEIVADIYEAAIMPSRWGGVLQKLADVCSGKSGSLIVFPYQEAPSFVALPLTAPALDAFVSSGTWKHNTRPHRAAEVGSRGFVTPQDYSTPELLRQDPVQLILDSLGLGDQLGLPTRVFENDYTVVTLERAKDAGPFPRSMLDHMQQYAPHLSRACLLAAQIRLQQFQTMVAFMEAVGLPAFVATPNGKLLAANALFGTLDNAFVHKAFDRIMIASQGSDVRFQEALQDRDDSFMPRSIAVPSIKDLPPFVLHVLPIQGIAGDLFSSSSSLVVATVAQKTGKAPPADMVRSLFDLSQAEARLAANLAAGLDLRDAVVSSGVTYATGRTYLARIFEKTGVNRQSELVRLLQAANALKD